jgi:ubiquinone biosynthesis protein Coq4
MGNCNSGLTAWRQSITLREGLEHYYRANPTFAQNHDIQVGLVHIPWQDLLKHDMMHVVTGYNTDLDQELRLIGFLLTALTWRRPWYYYAQSFGVFLELLRQSICGKSWSAKYYNPVQVCQLYLSGVSQGARVRQKIDAYINPESVLDRTLESLREEYGIQVQTPKVS